MRKVAHRRLSRDSEVIGSEFWENLSDLNKIFLYTGFGLLGLFILFVALSRVFRSRNNQHLQHHSTHPVNLEETTKPEAVAQPVFVDGVPTVYAQPVHPAVYV